MNDMNQKGLSRLPKVENHTLIFERTLGGGLFQQATSLGLAAFFWALWGGLLLPLATYLLWLVAPLFGADRIMSANEESLPVLSLLTATGFALGACLIMLGALQWLFGKARPRPEETPSITLEELAEEHGLENLTLMKSWMSRRIVVHHHKDSSIKRIDTSL